MDIGEVVASSNSAEFRRKMVAVLLQTDWLMHYGAIVKPEYFPSQAEQTLVRFINKYWDEFHSVPAYADVEHGTELGDVATYNYPIADLQYAAAELLDFAKVQAIKLAILASVDDIQRGDLAKPEQRVREALKVGLDSQALGLDLVQDLHEWMYTELHGKRWPTGWGKIDHALGGGIVAGEYGLVMAPPGMGKTTMLVNIGYACAGLLAAGNVLHVSLEIPEQQVLSRYAARVLGKRLQRDEDNEAQFESALRKRAAQRLRGHLRVTDAARSVDKIAKMVDDLKLDGFETHVLIIDYPDLMGGMQGQYRSEKRFEIADTTRELRELGHELGIAVWGATQSGRDSMYKEIITIANVAEAIEKAAIADVVISLCQTVDEEKTHMGRLYAAKMRRAEGHFTTPIKIDFAAQAIVAME